ncbi:MAG: hypothetical protein KAX49_17955 [Halanaerobiales bacterium]|nr:hypothetical protein [Halanaerobiales bacterium]
MFGPKVSNTSVTLDSAENITSNKYYSYTYSLPDGDYYWQVIASDNIENTVSDMGHIIVDLTDPDKPSFGIFSTDDTDYSHELINTDDTNILIHFIAIMTRMVLLNLN